jgi:hypothetical protein
LADGNAASAVIVKLWVLLVCAPLDHLPPACVRPSGTFAKWLTAAYFPFCIEAKTTAPAHHHPAGILRRGIALSPNEAIAKSFHYHLPAIARHSSTTGTSAAFCISAAKICSPNGYFPATLTQANKEGLALTDPVEAQNGQYPILLSSFVLESSRGLIRHGGGLNLPSLSR